MSAPHVNRRGHVDAQNAIYPGDFLRRRTRHHLEHHLYPQVPLYNLQRLHGLLYQRQSYAASAHLNTSYCFGQRSVLKEVVNDAPPHSS